MTPYYSADGIVLYHGDCREILPRLHRVDHVITDAPYNAQTHAGARGGNTKGGTTFDVYRIPIDFDPIDVAATLPLLVAAARRWIVIFCALEMLGDYKRIGGPAYVRSGFWRRLHTTPQFSGDRPAQPGEALAILHSPARDGPMRWNGGGSWAFYEAMTVRTARFHPTQKPEELMIALVLDFTDPGDVVLDPYMGSGTTLVAAKRLGRKAIGIELDEAHCETAALRLAQNVLDFEEVPA